MINFRWGSNIRDSSVERSVVLARELPPSTQEGAGRSIDSVEAREVMPNANIP